MENTNKKNMDSQDTGNEETVSTAYLATNTYRICHESKLTCPNDDDMTTSSSDEDTMSTGYTTLEDSMSNDSAFEEESKQIVTQYNNSNYMPNRKVNKRKFCCVEETCNKDICKNIQELNIHKNV